MNRLFLFIAAASSIVTAVPMTSEAAPWESIRERQVKLSERINDGVRTGALTRAESIVLQGEFRTLADLELQYRRSGGVLTASERLDLDRRFDALSRRIRVQRHDYEYRPGDAWIPINSRQARIFSRIEDGVRRGDLTRAEASRLRGDFTTLVKLESEYRRSGGVFTLEERNDLGKRLERLSLRVMFQRRDAQDRW